MADSKITALTSISTSTDPANDPLVIVDISDTSMAATGTTKKVTLNNLLACSPTATLASATITGDLTVDTSTLKVDSANNRVGIGTATPGNLLSVRNEAASGISYLDVRGGVGGAGVVQISGNGTTLSTTSFDLGQNSGGAFIYQRDALPLSILVNGSERYAISSTGVATWSNVGGVAGTAMTLNSTGLGVGGSPTSTLSIFAGADGDVGFFRGGSTRQVQIGTSATAGYLNTDNGSAGFEIRTQGTARAYFDNSGNVGIGVTPSDKLTVLSDNYLSFQTAVTTLNSGRVGRIGSVSVGTGNGSLVFETYKGGSGGGERMRIDSDGNLLVGTTSNNPGGTQSQFVNQWSGGSKWGSTFNQTVSSASYYTHIAFCTNGTVRGSIDANNAAITYGTVSDYRLKEAVQPLVGGLARISALKPSTYKWKESQSDGEGFIAHELASVVPLAVIGEKDAVNEDGSIKAQQVDLSKVVPVLVAAIQELTARVQTLETR